MTEWSEALLRDWHKETPQMQMPSWDSLVKTRVNNPNILMRANLFDNKIEEMMSTKPKRFCVNPKMHELVYTGTKENMRLHKDQCWTEQEVEVERNLLRVQNMHVLYM